jgi:hypothetical protein
MDEAIVLDIDNPFLKESFNVVFLPVLRDVVDEFVGFWNLHKVKRINENEY